MSANFLRFTLSDFKVPRYVCLTSNFVAFQLANTRETDETKSYKCRISANDRKTDCTTHIAEHLNSKSHLSFINYQLNYNYCW